MATFAFEESTPAEVAEAVQALDDVKLVVA
jgi:hypothetical protein